MSRCARSSRSGTRRSRLVFLFALSALAAGCTLGPHAATTPAGNDGWQPWQILETATGRVIPSEEWLKNLAAFDIIYLGEEHHNRHHIEAALRVLTALSGEQVRPAIGMEMFGWDGQAALNGYLEGRGEVRESFLEQARWKQNWGGPFEDYEPLVAFARDHHLPIYAMNPPKSLIRQVAKEGLAQARQGTEWTSWRMQDEEIVDDPAYRARLLDQLRRCHGGGSDDDYRTMYEASTVRDEGMARTLAETLWQQRAGSDHAAPVIVSYTGGGHIQYRLPVPKRVARRLSGQVRDVTIYLASYDQTRGDEIRELLHDRIADYIWLTPLSRHGAPQRCR